MEHSMRTASVLIRTLNEEADLASTLDAVLAQSVPPHEVVVVDSGSTDRTLEIARRRPVTIIEIQQREWSYPRALNVGAARTTGEILVSLSAHCRPLDETWLAALLRHFDDPRVAAVWGPGHRYHRPFPPPGPPQVQEHGSYTSETRMWGLSNANSALRRSLWLEVPFDERLPAAEDKAWGAELMRRGYCIVYEPVAGVVHGRHSVRAAYRRSRAGTEGFAMIFPGDDAPGGGGRRVGGAAWASIRHRIAHPAPRLLFEDLKQGFTTFSAMVGGWAARRCTGRRGPSR
jgi:rhamnosyltransferase